MSISRRDFIKTSVAAGAVASMGSLPLFAERASASSLVTLGKSGVKVTRLAFGTGSKNGQVQSSLGQKEFSRLVAYAYERGVRFFETSESYTTPAMLGEALKPFPRDSYQLMSKVTTEDEGDPLKKLDEFRRTKCEGSECCFYRGNPSIRIRCGVSIEIERNCRNGIKCNGTIDC